MSQSDVTERADLILRGKIAGMPMSVTGTVEAGSLAGFSGSVSIEKSLASLLDDLGAHFGEAGARLRELLGDSGIDKLTLDRLAFGYRAGTPKYVQLVATLTAGEVHCQFVLLKAVEKNGGFLIGLNLGLDSKSPLKNDFLSGLVGEISLGDLGVYYASQAFQDVSLLTQEVEQGVVLPSLARPETKPRTFPQGPTVSAEILVGGMVLFEEPSARPGPPESAVKEAEAAAPVAKPPAVQEKPEAASAGLQKWFPVKKTFGPLHVQRVGLEWRDAKLGLLLDAGVDLLGLSVGLLGFALRVKPGGDDGLLRVRRPTTKNIEFGLDGLELSFKQGPIEISGGFLRHEIPTGIEYSGTALIRAEKFTIAGFGSYTSVNGKPSLFVYALYEGAIGGPAFFFVTGLAAGFGYNREIKLPPLEKVKEFPLVAMAVSPDSNIPGTSLLAQMSNYIPPAPGNYWLAVGVRFTSFKLIDSFALLTVEFGARFEFALLGFSTFRQPPEKSIDPIAYVEMALKARFSPDDGVLAVQAVLTPDSYIFAKDCRLAGGFAFYAWFKGEHEGDFVVTLGGYHPKFLKPAHYPSVPRLGLNWKIGNEVTIKGECYCALTPSCVMAGGKLSAVYQSGDLRAWFIAYADFLISWNPFYYDVEVGVSIGASYRMNILGASHTLSVELGAMVHLWGPPFAGEAEIHWWIISCTVRFGAFRTVPKRDPISWDQFRKSFLPRKFHLRQQSLDDLGKKGVQLDVLANLQPLVGQEYQSEEKFVSALDKTLKKATPSDLRALVLEHADNPDPITIAITAGLIKQGKTKDSGEEYIIVNPDQLVINVQSAIPITRVNGNPGKPSTCETNLGIRPMTRAGTQTTMDSSLEVKLNGRGKNPDGIVLNYRYATKGVPEALWSQEPGKTTLDGQPVKPVIQNVLAGMELSPREREENPHTTRLNASRLGHDLYKTPVSAERSPEIDSAPTYDDTGAMRMLAASLSDPNTKTRRQAILDALRARRIIGASEVDLSRMAASLNEKSTLLAPPIISPIGDKIQRQTQ